MLWMTRFAMLLALLIVASHAQAVDVFWDDEGLTDFWSDNANWDGDAQPTNAETANLESNFVELDDLEQVGGLILASGGRIDLPGMGGLEVQGDVSNDGVINVANSASASAIFIVNAATTLDGAGEVVLMQDNDFLNRFATISTGPNLVTHAATHTIRGEGRITGNWLNEGTIRAEETTGDSSATISFNNVPLFTNPGELRTSATGALTFASTNLDLGSTGKLIADTTPVAFTLTNSITGGEIASVGGGVFNQTGILDVFGSTNTATINIDDRLRTDSGGFINNGVINIDSGVSGSASLQFTEAGGEISGTGEVVLGRQTTSSISFSITFPFTNGAGHTIRGAGTINHPPTNSGVIRAEAMVGNILTINNATTNNNLMRADTGAVLRFTIIGDTVQGPAGRIEAADGGMVEFNPGFSLTGGSLDTEGSGKVVINGDNVFFEDVTNLGAIDMVANSTLRLQGTTFTNDGTITVNSDGGFAAPGPTILLENDITLDGTGEVVLVTPGTFPAGVIDTFGNTLVNGVDHSIRGEGALFGIVENEGRIEGDSAAAPVEVFGRLSGGGTLRDVEIAASLFNNGVHAPTGVVPLEGTYELEGAFNQLEIELGGLTPGDHDQLASTGEVTLNGVLDVSLVNDYLPTPGDTFTIITATDPLVGTFTSEELPTNAPNFVLDWDVQIGANTVTIELLSATALPGDYNADGAVDAADYTVWRDSLGATGVPAFSGADGDGDGDITQDDYGVWVANFGNAAPAVAIPEPTSWVLLFAASATGVLCGPQRRGR